MNRLLASVLAVLLLGAGGLWFVSQRSAGPSLAPEALQPQASSTSEASPPLESEARAAQHTPAAPSPPTLRSAPDPIVGPKATLEVVCVRQSDGRALPGVAIRVEREIPKEALQPAFMDDAPSVPASTSKGVPARGWEDVTDSYFPPRTDSSGRVSIDVPAGVELLVLVTTNLRQMEPEQSSCAPLRQGEQRRVAFQCRTSEGAILRGCVLEAGSREPLSGVRILLQFSSQSELLASTGNDGRFEVAPHSPAGAALQLEKDGYVAQSCSVTSMELEAPNEHVFSLVRGASVQGFLLDPKGEALQMGSVCLSADSGLVMRSFCDSKGWYAFGGVPPGTSLRVAVERWNSQIFAADPLPALEAGETRRLDIRVPQR